MQRALFVVASALLGVALQVLYLRPLFDTDLGYDGWLDRHACLIESLCEQRLVHANHIGVLALVAAIALFAGAFATGRVRLPTPDAPPDAPPVPGARRRDDRERLAFTAGALLLLLVSVTTVRGEVPGVLLWAVMLAVLTYATSRRSSRCCSAPSITPHVAVFIGCAGIAFALGTASVSLAWALLLAVVGAASLRWAAVRLRAQGSTVEPIDLIVVTVMTGTVVLVAMARAWSTRYAFVGDEWTFYETARDVLAGRDGIDAFGLGGPNDYFTGATFEAQAAVMRVAGADVYGWRLAAVLPFALSVPLMYVFTRWLAGRAAAIVAAIVLGATHTLFGFTMVGYNNSQALLAISAALAALALAERRRTPIAYLLLGLAAGSTFIVYALARLALFPVGLLFLSVHRRGLRRGLHALGWTTLGFVATSAPVLFNLDAWERLVKATPVEAEAAAAEDGVARQVGENVIAGLLQFIGNVRNTHFIYGPHLDLISATLVVVGLGYAASRLGRDRRMTAWLVGSVGFWVAVNGIQQYPQISNTRSFVMPLVHCVYAGIAVAAMRAWWGDRRLPLVHDRVARFAPVGVLAFAAVLIAVNQLHIDRMTNERQQLTAEAVLVEQVAASAARDGSGMPVYILWPAEWTVRESIVLAAHDVSPDRGVFLRPEELYSFTSLCTDSDPAMVIVHAEHPDRDPVTEHLTRCWTTAERTIHTDPYGDPRVVRFVNAAGAAELDRPTHDRRSTRPATEILATDDAVDVDVDVDGRTWVLSRHGSTRARLTAYDERGNEETSFALDQWHPIDLAITDEGHLLVAGSGTDAPLVWYNGAGQPVQRYDGGPTIGQVAGVAAGPSGSVYVSDAERDLVLHLDRHFELVTTYAARGTLDGPAAIALASDESLWIYSSGAGEIMRVSKADEPGARLPAQRMQPHEAPRLTAGENGSVIVAEPEGPQIHQYDPDGAMLRAWGPFRRPVAAAPDGAGDLVVVDSIWPEVRVVAGRGVQPGGTTGRPTRLQTTTSINLALVDPAASALGIDRETVDLDGIRYVPVGTPGFSRPFAVAVVDDPASPLVVVSDPAARALVVLDGDGAMLGSLPIDLLGGGGELSDVATSPSGDVYVLDAGAARLHRLTIERTDAAVDEAGEQAFAPPRVTDDAIAQVGDGRSRLRLGDGLWATHHWTIDEPAFSNARGLGVDDDGAALVAATTAGAIVTVGVDGEIIERRPVRDGASQPTDVVTADGRLLVVDAGSLELLSLQDGVEVAVALPDFNSLEAPHLATYGTAVVLTDPEAGIVRTIEFGAGADRNHPVIRPAGQPATKTIGVAAEADGTLWTVDSGGAAVVRIDAAGEAPAE